MYRCIWVPCLAALLAMPLAAGEAPKPDQQAQVETLVKDLFLNGDRYGASWKVPAGKLAQIGPATIPALVKQIKAAGSNGYAMSERGAATIRLMGVQALPAIAETLEKNPHGTRDFSRSDYDMLRKAMASFGRDALPFADRLMKSEVPGVRIHAVEVYAAIGNEAPEALQAMIGAMKSGDADVRRKAVCEMRTFGREGLAAVLAEVKPEETDLLTFVMWNMSLTDTDKNPLPPESLSYVKAYIKENRRYVGGVMSIIERIGPPARELLPDLLKTLATAREGYALDQAKETIAAVNANDGGLEGAIAEGLAHADPTVRSWCLEYLKAHATKTETLREAVRKVEAQQGDHPTDETVKAMELLKEPAEKP